MKAAAFDQYGPPEMLHVELVPTPQPSKGEILIRIDTAGVGVWDPQVRSGAVEMGDGKDFPRVIGNDGSGRVAALGKGVTGYKVGDRVYSYDWDAGFYAEYAAVSQDKVAPVPRSMSLDEAGALGADGITALIGLEDTLKLRKGERILIFGASGGVGHLAVQLARRMGALVVAVASGEDGVRLVRSLGVRDVVEGHSPGLTTILGELAPDGFDAALMLAGGRAANQALRAMKSNGRVAFPNGVEPEPRPRKHIAVQAFNGVPTPEALARLNRWIGSRPFTVALQRLFPLDEAAAAHRAVAQHHLGKVALHVRHLE
jgi:NADPH:quinone reductase-like Zn-dependent oxidoreductase